MTNPTKTNPTPAGEEVARCYKEVVVRGERCRCVLPDLHSFLCEMRPASQPPSARPAEQIREALRVLYEETADYIRINNLGDVHHNRSMQMARDALGIAAPKSSTLGEEKMSTSSGDSNITARPLKKTGEKSSADGRLSAATPSGCESPDSPSASAPDAGQPIKLRWEDEVVEEYPAGLTIELYRNGFKEALDVGVTSVKDGKLKVSVRVDEPIAAPSAPASAARELAHAICQMFDTQTWELRFTQLEGEIEELLDTHIGEQTRQLRSQMLREVDFWQGEHQEQVRRAQAAEAERDKLKETARTALQELERLRKEAK